MEKTLKIWKNKEKIFSDNIEAFNALIKVCLSIKYYDSEHIISEFSNYFDNNNINFDDGNEYYLMPYKTKGVYDDPESSKQVYFWLKSPLNIPKGYSDIIDFSTEYLFSCMINVFNGNKQSERENEIGQEMVALKNIILIDDFLGSGNSIKKLFDNKNIFKEIEEINFTLKEEEKITITIVCLASTYDGEQNVKNEIKRYSFINIVSLNYSLPYYKSSILDASENMALEKKLKTWNKNLNRKSRKTIKQYNKDLTVCSEANVPNNDIPILWMEVKGHKPLLIRKKKKVLVDLKKNKDKILFVQSERSKRS